MIEKNIDSVKISAKTGRNVDNLIKKIKDGEDATSLELYIATFIDKNEQAFKMKLIDFTNSLSGAAD